MTTNLSKYEDVNFDYVLSLRDISLNDLINISNFLQNLYYRSTSGEKFISGQFDIKKIKETIGSCNELIVEISHQLVLSIMEDGENASKS
jgi:hypothetical protein